mgnify:CR=1 FL=1
MLSVIFQYAAKKLTINKTHFLTNRRLIDKLVIALKKTLTGKNTHKENFLAVFFQYTTKKTENRQNKIQILTKRRLID